MIVYLDCRLGVSGDMLVAGLIDAGADIQMIELELEKVGIAIRSERATRGGISAASVFFETGSLSAETWGEVANLVTNASLDSRVSHLALSILERLAVAEGRVHDQPIDEVRFHELSAGDTIADAVSFATALSTLAPERVLTSEIGVGGGTVETQHGLLAVPPPATLELLAGAGLPMTAGPVAEELATPTGAACLAAVASYSPMPGMRVTSFGYGAGSREFPNHPNVTRVLVGEPIDFQPGGPERLLQIEATIDDMNPEIYEYAIEQLREAGVADAWVVPTIGKRGRPAAVLTALCAEELEQSVVGIFATETSTLGVRVSDARRWRFDREIQNVEVRGMPIRIKVGRYRGEIVNAAPEYSDCAEAARKLGEPLKHVYLDALTEWRSGNRP